MKKLKKSFAILICVILVLIYAATLIFAICDFKGAEDLFKASIYLTIILPVLLYAYLLMYRYFSKANKATEEEDSKDIK